MRKAEVEQWNDEEAPPHIRGSGCAFIVLPSNLERFIGAYSPDRDERINIFMRVSRSLQVSQARARKGKWHVIT